MNRFPPRILLLGFLLPFLSLACKKNENLPEEARAGQIFFHGYGCTNCHRVAGEGGLLGPDLTFVGFRQSPEWIDQWLKNPSNWRHNTLMPNFYLKDPVRKALVAYLSTLKGEPYITTKPWNHPEVKDDPVKRGEMIFAYAGCTGCHGVQGKGGHPNNNVVGGLIPTLTKVSEGYSKEELKEKIRKGVPESAMEDSSKPKPMVHMPTWSQKLTDDEIDSLVEYLYSLAPKTEGGEKWE